MLNTNFLLKFADANKGHYTFEDNKEAFVRDRKNNVNEDQLSKVLLSPSTEMNLAYSAFDHPNMTSKVIGDVLESPTSHMWKKKIAVQHDKATPEQLQKVLELPNSDPANYALKSYAINNNNITSDNITTALKDPESSIRISAMEHPKAEEKHFRAGLTDPDYRVNTSASRRLRTLQSIYDLNDPILKD